MITVRQSDQRGHFNHGWLNTYHTFSFGDYYDSRNIGFRQLRVINEDWIEPGRGFPTHPHRDMEILTYVLEGGLKHRDSMGNGSVIRPGEVQRMSAGTGVTHSEYNPSPSDPVHLLQIWILPERRELTPSYEQKTYAEGEKHGKLRLVASQDGRDGSVTIHQDVDLYSTLIDPGQAIAFSLRPSRHVWIQVARGAVSLNGHLLQQGDGAAVSQEESLRIVGKERAEVLLFDLA